MLEWIVALYLSMTMFVHGLSMGGVVLSAATVLSVVGCCLTCFKRIRDERPLLSLKFLAEPAVIFALAYFAVGVSSGYFAADKDRWMREIVQRAIIILLPLYFYVFGPSHPRVLLRALVYYLPVCGLLGFATFLVALKTGMHAPVYIFGMHKNGVGADCAHLVVICLAFLLAKQFPRQRILVVGLMGLGIMGIVGAQARAALVGTVLAAFLMMLANRARVRHLIVAALVLICGLGVLVIALPKEAIKHAVTTERFSSNALRQDTWAVISEKLKNDPLMCVGWGNPIFTYADAHLDTGFASKFHTIVPDCASIFYYDWGQMSFLGVLAQLAMFGSSLLLSFSNARRCPLFSPLSAINLAALGIMTTRFEQAYLDSFWVGRGPTLATFAAVGMVVFVRLWLDQSEEMRNRRRVTSDNVTRQRTSLFGAHY